MASLQNSQLVTRKTIKSHSVFIDVLDELFSGMVLLRSTIAISAFAASDCYVTFASRTFMSSMRAMHCCRFARPRTMSSWAFGHPSRRRTMTLWYSCGTSRALSWTSRWARGKISMMFVQWSLLRLQDRCLRSLSLKASALQRNTERLLEERQLTESRR